MARTYVTVRQKRLGYELRKAREACAMTLEQAASVLECTKAKMSRIENGTNGIRPYELRGLLNTYGVTDTKLVDALVDMAKEGSRRGWWNRYAEVLPGLADLAHLESKAVSIQSWETTLVPGLLQTPDFMRALFRHGRFSGSDPEIEKSVEARLARQRMLAADTATAHWAILYEAVLHTDVGGPSVHRAQLAHLADLVESDRVTVQVMPFGTPAHNGLDGPFTLFTMPAAGMDVVRAASIASPVYVEDDDQVQRYRALFDIMRASALGPAPSLDRIRRAATSA